MAPEEIAIHLEACPTCQRQLAAIRLLDGAVRRRLSAPPGLSERICRQVRLQTAEAPLTRSPWWAAPGLRLAAGIVLAAAAMTLAVRMLQPDGTTDTPATTVAAVETPATVVEPPHATAGPESGTPTPVISDGARRLAGTRASDGAVGLAASDLPQRLPRQIRHVWTVNDPKAEAGYLQTLLAQGSYAMSAEDGNTVVDIMLADRELQKLVDRLAERKWQLVSPGVPQPQRPDGVVLTGQTISYRLVMVSR